MKMINLESGDAVDTVQTPAEEIPGGGAIADTDDMQETPLPIECFPLALRDIAEDVARVQQSPIEIAILSALTAISGAAGAAFVVDGAVSGRRTHGNLFVVLAAPRGAGKGSSQALVVPILDASRRLVEHFNAETLPEIEADAAIAEARANALLTEIKKNKDEAQGALLRNDLIAAKQTLANARALAAGAPSYWCANSTSEAPGALSSVLWLVESHLCRWGLCWPTCPLGRKPPPQAQPALGSCQTSQGCRRLSFVAKTLGGRENLRLAG